MERTLDPATAAYQEHGYNDLPVEAKLGPHTFRIPANYFRDQIGPDFQGRWSLMVQWPDLEPLPPGERSGQDMETFGRQVTISPRHVDSVPIETRLEVSTKPSYVEPGEIEYKDPRKRLDLMLPQPQQYGLTPYVVDTRLLSDYSRAYQERVGVPLRTTARTYKDWFVRRSDAGQLQTLIRCDHLPSPAEHASPVCDHDFVIPGLDVAVSINYRRDYLSGWERIEGRARGLIEQYRAR